MPFSTGDGYAAPGRALQQMGRAIGDVGDGFASLQKEQDDLDLFKAKIAYTEFQGLQDQKQVDYDIGIKNDGQGHTDGRLQQYDTDFADLTQRVPQSKRAQQFVALHGTERRNTYHRQSYGREMEQRGTFYLDATGKLITERVLPKVTGELDSAERALLAVDGILAGSDGMPEMVRTKAREAAADAVYKTWLDKAGPEAGAQFEELRQRYLSPKMQNPDDTGGLDVPADAVRPIAGGRIPPIGSLSAKYESGGRGVGFISSGKGDPGGKSYGIHQLSGAYSMGAFLRSDEGAPYRDEFKGARPTTPEFNAIYKDIAARDPDGFAEAQRNFYTRTHYEPVRAVAEKAGFDVTNRGVQEALFSMSVQHGKAKQVVERAAEQLGKDASPAEQIKALYHARHGYVAGLRDLPDDTKSSVLNRYRGEVRDALRVASASGAVELAQAPQKSTSDYFRERLLRSGPEIYQKALQAERRMDAEQKRVIAEEDKKVVGEGVDLLAKKQLTTDWIDSNKDRFASPWTAERFRRLVEDRGPRATDWREFAPVYDKAADRPEEAIEQALQLYADKKLHWENFNQIYSKATRELSRRTKDPEFIKRSLSDLRQQLRPVDGSPDEAFQDYEAALRAFDDHVDVSRKAKDGLSEKTIVQFKDKLIQDMRTQGLRRERQRLPSLPFIQKQSETIDLDDVRGALQQQLQNSGSMSPEEFNQRLSDLRRWDEQIQRELRLQGKPIPPAQKQQAPGGAQKPAGGLTQGPVGQGSQDPSSPFYDLSQSQQPQKKGWWPWGQPSKLGGPMQEDGGQGGVGSDAVAGGAPMQPGGGIGSDAVAGGTAGLAQGPTPDQQALIERMRGAGVDEATLMSAVRLANAPGDMLNDPATPREFKNVPFAGPMLNIVPLAMAIQQVSKGMVVEGWNTASRWLQATQQLPGAKPQDTLVAPTGTEDYQINPNRVEDHDLLAPLGLASMGNPVSALGRETLRAGAKVGRPSDSYSPSIGDRLVGKYLDATAPMSDHIDPVTGKVTFRYQTDPGITMGNPGRAHESGALYAKEFAQQPSVRTAAEISSEAANDPSHLRLLADQQRSSLPGAVGNALDQGATGASRTVEKVTPAKRFDADTVYYHGTPFRSEPIKEFDPKMIGTETDGGMAGRGFSFTRDRSHAEEYAYDESHPGVVGEYNLAISNPFLVRSARPGDAQGAAAIREAGKRIDPRVNLNSEGYLDSRGPGLTPEEWTESLKRAGHDGVEIKHYDGGDEILVFDAADIRPVSGRGDRSSGAASDSGELKSITGTPVPGQEDEDRRVPHLKRDQERRWSDKEFLHKYGADKFGKDDVLRSMDPLEILQYMEFIDQKKNEYPGVPLDQFVDEFREIELPKIRRKPSPIR